MSKTLYSVYRYIVLGLFLIINIWLFLLSIFSTSRLTADASERTYYTGDHVWLHIIILVVLIAAFYENNDYDTKKEAEVSKAEIKGYIDTYKNDHKAFTSFLSKKVASQWNNPEFQCFWITNVRSSDIEKSPVISDILSLKGSSTFIAFLNIMQSIILLGSMLYAVNTLIEGTFAGAAVLPLTFIGGFIFHLFWEGKCQYTLPYFMLLLPLSIIGFYSMAKKLSYVTKKHLYKCGVFAVILLFIAIIFNSFIILNQDNKSYRQYREYTIEQQKL